MSPLGIIIISHTIQIPMGNNMAIHCFGIFTNTVVFLHKYLQRRECLPNPASNKIKTFFLQSRQLHDVNGWAEDEVADWFYSLGDSGSSDLAVYAELFVKNNITGRRLFLLTGDDLLQIGVLSVGHRREIMVSKFKVELRSIILITFPPSTPSLLLSLSLSLSPSLSLSFSLFLQDEIEKLRQENHRLIHFPPLNKVHYTTFLFQFYDDVMMM